MNPPEPPPSCRGSESAEARFFNIRTAMDKINYLAMTALFISAATFAIGAFIFPGNVGAILFNGVSVALASYVFGRMGRK